jgi:lysozyme family protein
LKYRTVNVPKGRPLTLPSNKDMGYSFEDSAFDLVKLKGYDKVPLWSIETLLYYFEVNNGFGYRRLKKPISTPYLWSGTTYYTAGKFVADGRYDSKKVDEQIGCAPLLRYLTDKTLKLV